MIVTGICAVCGVRRPQNDKNAIPFPTNSFYRSRFAATFDYDADFVWSLGRSVRICKAHFVSTDIEGGKAPTQMPTLELGRVGSWPRAKIMSESGGATSRFARCPPLVSSSAPAAAASSSSSSTSLARSPATFSIFTRAQSSFLPSQMPTTSAASAASSSSRPLPFEDEEEIIDVVGDGDVEDAAAAQEEEERNIGANSAALVEIAQLLQLFQYCYVCGTKVGQQTIEIKKRVGNVSVLYRCKGCKKRRRWEAQSTAPSRWPLTTVRLVAAAVTSAFSLIVSASLF